MHNAYGETEGEWLSSIALHFGFEAGPLTNSVRAACGKVSGILSFFHSAGITGTHHYIQLFLEGVSRQGFSVALEPVLELALVDQTGLELRDLPASASRVLGLKACISNF